MNGDLLGDVDDVAIPVEEEEYKFFNEVVFCISVCTH